jgi:hypothetical protein
MSSPSQSSEKDVCLQFGHTLALDRYLQLRHARSGNFGHTLTLMEALAPSTSLGLPLSTLVFRERVV